MLSAVQCVSSGLPAHLTGVDGAAGLTLRGVEDVAHSDLLQVESVPRRGPGQEGENKYLLHLNSAVCLC